MGKLWIGDSNGCWLDIWDKPKFKGHSRRLFGPADFPYLRFREPDWGEHIQSMKVGPGAYVQCFEDLNFYDSVIWLLPNQQIDDALHLDCSNEIDSIRLSDRPPFAHEPGYSAYMLWAANYVTKPNGK